MKIRTWVLVVAVLLGAGIFLSLPGCGRSGVPTKQTYSIPMKGPLDQAKALLENYASGAPVGSEASGFADLVNEVRKTDPAKADILEKGLAELQKTPPQAAAAKAKEILEQLNK